jgi:hypothetical protein
MRLTEFVFDCKGQTFPGPGFLLATFHEDAILPVLPRYSVIICDDFILSIDT